MPLLDDLALPNDEKEMSRRRFLSSLGTASLALIGIGGGVATIRFMRPRVLFEAETRFKACHISALPIGGVLAMPERKVYILRTPEGVFAMSMVCTHLGCMTRYEQDRKRIFCPCHGSQFNLRGVVIGGPAPRPLPRLELAIKDGFLIVDTQKLVSQDFILKV